MTRYVPACRCPKCTRRPNVAYSAEEVARAKKERQAARVNHVQCPRCGFGYWVTAAAIASAIANPNRNGVGRLPAEFPARAELDEAGILYVDQLREVSDLTSIPGIGAARARAITNALDTLDPVA